MPKRLEQLADETVPKYADVRTYRTVLDKIITFVNWFFDEESSANPAEGIGYFQDFERFLLDTLKNRNSISDLNKAINSIKLVRKGYPFEIANGQYLDIFKAMTLEANSYLKRMMVSDDPSDHIRFSESGLDEMDMMVSTRRVCLSYLGIVYHMISESHLKEKEIEDLTLIKSKSKAKSKDYQPTVRDIFLQATTEAYSTINMSPQA